jgi:phosphoesterase RecJ-like protein
LVNFLAGTEGSRTAAILYQVSNGWRVSLRSLSDDVDVAAIASVFGGGGHPRAAGCSVTGTEADKLAFIYQLAELSDRSWGSRRHE